MKSQVTTGNGQKRLAIRCSDAFCCCCLTHSGYAVKQYNDTLAFLANQVKSRVFGPVFGKVSADERLDDAFVILWDLKVLPGVGPMVDMCEILSITIVQPQACLIISARDLLCQ